MRNSLTEETLVKRIRDVFKGHEGAVLPATRAAVLRVGVDSLDDAAVIDLGATSLVIATDFVRGEGFNLFKKGIINRYDIGYYVAVANLSDIAAMGAKPAGLLVVLRCPKEDLRYAVTVLRGIRAACDAHGVVVVGGDTGTYEAPVLAATAFGFARGRCVFRRSDAVDGHRVFVSGCAGLAGTALFYFMQREQLGLKLTQKEERILANTWRRPRARVDLAEKLSRVKGTIACQDISDGLRRTLEQIGEASGVRLAIRENRLPIHELTRKVAAQAGMSPTVLAMSDSVDFGLVLTCAQLPASLLSRELGDGRFTEIGVVRPGKGCVIESEGSSAPLPGIAWTQQTDDITKLIYSAGVRKGRAKARGATKSTSRGM